MARKTKKKGKIKKGSKCKIESGHYGGSIYGLGFLGSAVYYLVYAPNIWSGVLGVIKSLIWPTFLVYEFMKFLGM